MTRVQVNTIEKLIEKIEVFRKIGEQLMLKTATAALAVIVVIISIGVVKRYVLDSPLVWTEEMSTFLFVWVSFLGAGVASSRQKHVYVDLFVEKFSEKRKKQAALIVSFFTIIFFTIVIIGGINLQPITSRSASVTLNIPKNYYYLPVLIACSYMLIIEIGQLLKIVLSGPAISKVNDDNIQEPSKC